MSEEEIIKGITNIIYTCNDIIEDNEWYDQEEIESAKEQLKFTEGLLDLYNKQKEANKSIVYNFEKLVDKYEELSDKYFKLLGELNNEEQRY